jgi:puromycin-sensitive aminopeptidase
VAGEARRRFDAHFSDPSVLPSEYKTTVYKIVLMNGGEAEYERVKATYYATEDNVERKYAMNSLGATRLPHLQRATLDWALKSGDVKMQDCFYPVGAVASSSKAGSALAWQYYRENFAAWQALLAKASPSLMDATIVYSTQRSCTAAKADEIEAFFAAHPLPSSARRISQSVEMIRSSGAMLDRIRQSRLVQAGYW